MNSLQDISKNRKTEADKILKDSRLLDMLSKFGRASVIGSYKYDLMYDPDIDVIVETDNPRESALKSMNAIFQGKYFRKLEIGDFENFPMPNRPGSYILVLKTTQNETDWEIEIWFHKLYPTEILKLDEQMKNITEEEKDAILKMKHQRELQDQSKKDLSSFKIYKNIFEGESIK